MSRVCEATGKSTMSGGTRQHNRGKAGGTSGPWAFKATRKPRKWKLNLRNAKVTVDGVPETIKISMKYYRKLKEEGRIYLKTRGKYASVA